jgi:hypothetical protein
MKVEEITLDWLLARTKPNEDYTDDENDPCMEWTGCFAKNGSGPMVTIDNKTLLVRRVIYALAHDCQIRRDRSVCPAFCRNPKCVHPNHLRALEINSVKRGRKYPLATRAAMARGKRAASRWDDATIAAILASEASADELAAQHGMDRSYVYYLRHGRSRVDYHNPYAQLMGGA